MSDVVEAHISVGNYNHLQLLQLELELWKPTFQWVITTQHIIQMYHLHVVEAHISVGNYNYLDFILHLLEVVEAHISVGNYNGLGLVNNLTLVVEAHISVGNYNYSRFMAQ